MIIPNQEQTIQGRTEKSTTLITSVDIDTNHPDIEHLLLEEQQNRIIYGITLILLIISFLNIYAW
jgi:hypothetical protein